MSTSHVSQLEFDVHAAAADARAFEGEGKVSRPTLIERAHRAPDHRIETGAVESLCTFAEAARTLGISLRQFRRLVDGGKIAFVKVSERSPRIPPSELQRFLAASVVKYSEVKS